MPVHSITTERSLEQLVTDCQEGVERIARKWVATMKHADFDDLVQIGMEAVIRCARSQGMDCPIEYYLRAAKCKLLDYWKCGHDDLLSRDRRSRSGADLLGVLSLDVPVGPESDACLLDFLESRQQSTTNDQGEHIKVVEQALEKLAPAMARSLGSRFGLTGYGESHGRDRKNATHGVRRLRTILSAPLEAQPTNQRVSSKLPLAQRCCLVCRNDLKRRVPGAVYNLHGRMRFMCRMCNCQYWVNQVGIAMQKGVQV